MRIIGNDPSVPRQTQEVASGTLPNGKPVVVNADGTVSVAGETSIPDSAGTPVVFEAADVAYCKGVYDSTNQKVVIVYRDNGNSYYGTAVVGTASGSSISFGSAVVFESANTSWISIAYDVNAEKVVISYRDQGNSNYGTAIVGTVSGTSISFGSAAVFESADVKYTEVIFDSSNNKIVIAYQDVGNSNHGTAIVGTVNGLGISFGSPNIFESAATYVISATFDSTNQKVVIAYSDAGNSYHGTAIVGTVSGTSISFGSVAVFENSETSSSISATFDSNAQKVVIAYRNDGNSAYGTAAVGTVSGTSISFGTPVVFESANTFNVAIAYDAGSQKVVVAYKDNGNSNYGTAIVGTVSGTSISFGTAIVFESDSISQTSATYDANAQRVVIAYEDVNNSGYGTAVVFQTGSISTNITSENYIGMSSGTAFQTGSAAAVGTAVQFEAGDPSYKGVAYDTNADRVVIAYQDGGNSNYGTAIVGTVDGSNNSISFGSAVVFESAASTWQCIAYDANAQKVVIAYGDGGNSNYGTAIVGTVSGTSISFGSAAVFNSAATTNIDISFDSNSNKVVVGYRDSDTKGYAIVGTVSGTNISFGSEAKFNDASTTDIRSAYDANAQKIVFAYANYGSSGAGTAIVGTVSGTNITFGSAAGFETGTASQMGIGYDSDSQKVVIAYKDEGDSNYGKAVVGTVSGTSISFGSIVIFNQANTEYSNVVYDTNVDKIIITYQDLGNSNYATVIVGTVSGTSISFGSETVLHSATSSYLASVYDPDQKRVVTAVRDQGSSSGKAIVFKPDNIATTRGEVTNGNHALVDTQGAISDNQIGLTAGQSYFVQTDGTLGTTAADPSVFAGTAVSVTKLIVKG